MAGKHFIFIVHGMGVYVKEDDKQKRTASNEWFELAEKSIKKAYESHKFLKKYKFDDHFEFRRINYDQYIDKVVVDTADTAKKLSGFLPTNTFLRQFSSFLEGSKGLKNNFFWTHAFDVVLYRYLGLLREEITTVAAAEIITQVLEDSPTGYSVIAHSLGCSVAHDALSKIQYRMESEGKLGIWPQAKIVGMIANVTRALEDESRPAFGRQILPSNKSGVEAYLTASHVLDPFTMIAPFEADGIPEWEDALDPEAFYRFYQVSGLEHFDAKLLSGEDEELSLTELVPHQFAHYFANPRVHLPIFSRIAEGARWPIDIDGYVDERARDFAKKTHQKSFFEFASALEGLVKRPARDPVPAAHRVFEFFRKALQQIGGK